ncbi:hypothetical protein [Methylobacterium sp. ID0610]
MRVMSVSLAILPIIVVLLVSSVLRVLTFPVRAVMAAKRSGAGA